MSGSPPKPMAQYGKLGHGLLDECGSPAVHRQRALCWRRTAAGWRIGARAYKRTHPRRLWSVAGFPRVQEASTSELSQAAHAGPPATLHSEYETVSGDCARTAQGITFGR